MSVDGYGWNLIVSLVEEQRSCLLPSMWDRSWDVTMVERLHGGVKINVFCRVFLLFWIFYFCSLFSSRDKSNHYTLFERKLSLIAYTHIIMDVYYE